MHFRVKNTLKNNSNYTLKHPLQLDTYLAVFLKCFLFKNNNFFII
jgi:hypothetical protein